MGQLTLRVNDKSYTLACRDGEEAQLVALAAYVDDKIHELVAQVGQVGETRLMLMAALLIADEMNEVKSGRGLLSIQDAAALLNAGAKRIEDAIEELGPAP